MKLWDLVAAALTPREQEVAYELLKGRRNKEIAISLGMAPHTVKAHIAHMFGKFGIVGMNDFAGTRVTLAIKLARYCHHA